MATYVAFLRGMNLGNRRVKNDELRACFEAMSFSGVWAFLASGNVVFEADASDMEEIETAIEQGMQHRFGYEVNTFVRALGDVAEMAHRTPFDEDAVAASNGKLQVSLLTGVPTDADRRAVLSMETVDDRLALEGRALYWLPRGNISDSDLDLNAIGKVLGPMTMRNQRTLARLIAKIDP